MANYLVTDTELTSVADAIRTKGGTSADLEFPSGFVTAIENISGGGSTLGTKTITANDTYDASDDSLDGYSQVTVNVPASAVDTGTKSISTNGTHDVIGYASASVSVPTGTARTSADLTASGATVTAPAGLYAEAASKSVASGSAATPATTVTANPTISVNSSTGVITASVSATQSVTPTVSAGYVSSGTAGTVTVSGSNTESLSTQAAQTIHPSTSDQTIASGKYLTGAQTVKGVLLTNLSAGNIKKDVVVKIGDSTDDDCVTSVTGTYEGGGGSTVLSGSFTPTADTLSVTISDLVGTSLDHFLVKVAGDVNGAKGFGKRVLAFGFVDFDLVCFFRSATGSAGTSLGYTSGGTTAGDTVFSFNRTTGVVSSANSNGGGYFPSGLSYVWYAW